MIPHLTLACLLCAAPEAHAGQPRGCLPTPHYHRNASDPPWLTFAAQFHGHLGPWATAGARAGIAARRAAGAAGYFDVEVTVEGPFIAPPRACFLDGIQVATGATLGKRNLKWIKADEIVVQLKNTRTGQIVEIRPTDQLLSILGSIGSRSKRPPVHGTRVADHHGPADRSLEVLARRIARLPERTILHVARTGSVAHGSPHVARPD